MMNLTDLESYNARRQALYLKFKGFRHGAQMDASHELWMSPSMVSGVLNGHYVDERKLERLEEWAEKNAEEYRAHRAQQVKRWAQKTTENN